jgi:hypothetical protein
MSAKMMLSPREYGAGGRRGAHSRAVLQFTVLASSYVTGPDDVSAIVHQVRNSEQSDTVRRIIADQSSQKPLETDSKENSELYRSRVAQGIIE